MAYSIRKPSGGGSTTVGRSTKISSYSGALEGFSSDLATLRKQIIDQQAAAMDYQIEVGASSIDEKIAMYQTYLTGLEEGTKEWYRVAKKIEDLKDSAASMDFALAKSLYAGGQMGSEEYYNILRQRAAEQGISDKEKQSRVLELHNFEEKIKDENTDKALRESVIQEELGLISSAERYRLIQTAYENEDDPDRRANLEKQLVTQAKKVRSEDLQRKELVVKKSINQGLATKADLIPIYEERAATALTETERLSAEVALQDLIQSVANERASAITAAGKDSVKYVKSLVNDIDTQIAEAKRRGDLTALYVLYGKKTEYINSFYNGKDPLTGEQLVLTEDDMEVSSFEKFMEDVHGIQITNPLTGDYVEVGTDDEYSFFNVEEAVSNPQAYGLAIEYKKGGKDATLKIVEGTRIGDNYVYGDYVQVGSRYMTDPETGEYIRDENGNVVKEAANPLLLERKKLSEGEMRQLEMEVKERDQKLPKGFTGEYIERVMPNGRIVREWIVEDGSLQAVAGAEKYNGLGENEYALTDFSGAIPTRQTIKDQKVGGLKNLAANALAPVGTFFDNALGPIDEVIAGQFTTPIGRLNQSADTLEKIKAGDETAGDINLDWGYWDDIASKVGKMTENLKFNFSERSQPLANQFTQSLFKPDAEFADTTFKAISNRDYKPLVSLATKRVVSEAINMTPLGGAIDTAKNVFGTVKNFFGWGK